MIDENNKMVKMIVDRKNIHMKIILQTKSIQQVNSLDLNRKTANFTPEK